jgi:nucleotide-binding universal stress UspA family protein
VTAPKPQITSILVGVDGSAESDHAAAFAGVLGAAIGARVITVHATGLLDVWPDHPEPGMRNSHAHVDELMHGAWTEPLRTAGVEPEIVIRDGPPAHVLLAVADELDVSLIVVGTRGVGQTDPYGLGSVATRLTHESTRPVVIVPRARA